MGSVLAGRYEIRATLGQGGMGIVYRAYDRQLDMDVAVKVLRAAASADPDQARTADLEMRRRFREEIKLSWKVQHKNVCAVHEYQEDGDRLFVSMEIVDGRDLKQLLHVEGPPAWEDAFDIVLQTGAGLAAIHEAGLIHRDLKTSNIMRDQRGRVKVMDFGIAKVWSDESGPGLTETGKTPGSPEYMSPEQVRGRRLDFRSDLYAFGVVIFELFTGQVPFPAPTPYAAASRHLEDEPPLEGPAAARIPAPLVPVLRRSLKKDPGDRYANCGEMLEALGRARAALNEQATDAVPRAAIPHAAATDASLPPHLLLWQAGGSRAADPRPHEPLAEARLLVPTLVKALKHREATVRMEAARALGAIGTESGRAALLEAEQDEDERVRAAAAAALAFVRARPDVPPPASAPATPLPGPPAGEPVDPPVES